MRKNLKPNSDSQWKSDHTPVTDVDIEINNLVIAEILSKYPSHSIIAEEGSRLQDSEYTWVCDPIDGTIAYSHGIPLATFSLALVKNGESIVGVTYNPFSNDLLTAIKHKGAQRNGCPISSSENENLTHQMVGIPIWGDERSADLKIIQRLKEKHVYTYNTCGIVQMGMLVAQGSLSGAIYFGQKTHDVAALKIIVEEAGGMVTNIYGRDQRYDQSVQGALITNGKTHNQLLEWIKDTVDLNQLLSTVIVKDDLNIIKKSAAI